MAQSLHHRYTAEPGIDTADVRAAISELTGDDISVSSPISPGAPEVGIGVSRDEHGTHIDVRVSGHAGDWTKTSETALRRAIQSVEGVGELAASDGGYDD